MMICFIENDEFCIENDDFSFKMRLIVSAYSTAGWATTWDVSENDELCIKNEEFCIKNTRNCVLKTRNSVFKTRNCVFKTRNYVLKTRNYVLKMMNLQTPINDNGTFYQPFIAQLRSRSKTWD